MVVVLEVQLELCKAEVELVVRVKVEYMVLRWLTVAHKAQGLMVVNKVLQLMVEPRKVLV